jgi:hypothetical protein
MGDKTYHVGTNIRDSRRSECEMPVLLNPLVHCIPKFGHCPNDGIKRGFERNLNDAFMHLDAVLVQRSLDIFLF